MDFFFFAHLHNILGFLLDCHIFGEKYSGECGLSDLQATDGCTVKAKQTLLRHSGRLIQNVNQNQAKHKQNFKGRDKKQSPKTINKVKPRILLNY